MKIILIEDDGTKTVSESFMFASFDKDMENFTIICNVYNHQVINAMNQLYENIQNGLENGKCRCNDCLKKEGLLNKT